MFSKYRNSFFAVLAFLCLFILSYLGCFTSTSSVSPDVFVQQAVKGVQTQALEHALAWRLGEEKNWVADQDTGTITFLFADGTSASAPMQIVGTYNIADRTFWWSWNRPNVKESLRKHAELARRFGEANQLSAYTQPMVTCTENEAWAFAATAAKLGNAKGAYEGPTGNTILLVTFGDVSLSKNSPTQ